MWSPQRRPLPQLSPLLFLALQIAMLLLCSSTSCLSTTASTTAEPSGEQKPFPLLPKEVISQINQNYKKSPLRIVLVGPTGAGKTTFCDLLRLVLTTSDIANPTSAIAEILRDRKQKDSTFLSDTKNVTKYTETLRGGGSVEIFDTPGLLDTGGSANDFNYMIKLGNFLKTLDYVDAVLFIFNGQKLRSDNDMKYLLAQFSTVFHPSVYSNIAVLFSYIDYNPRRKGSMISTFFSDSEFHFSPEEVKNRSFYVNNPLPIMVNKFDLNKREQTISSLLKSSVLKRFQLGVKEVGRLLQHWIANPSIKRCSNPGSGVMQLLSVRESLQRIPGLQQKFVSARETQARSVLEHKDPVSKYASEVSAAHESLQKDLSNLEVNQQLLALDYPKYLREMEEYLEPKKSELGVSAILEDIRSQNQALESLPPQSFLFDSNACNIYFLRSEEQFLKRVQKEFECDETDKKRSLHCLTECVCEYLKYTDDKEKGKAILDNVIRSLADDDRKRKWTQEYLDFNWVQNMVALFGPKKSVLERQKATVENRCSVYARALRCLRLSPNDKLEDAMMKFICNRHATLRSSRAMKCWRPDEETFEVKYRRHKPMSHLSLFGIVLRKLGPSKKVRSVIADVCDRVEQKAFASNEDSTITEDENREITGYMTVFMENVEFGCKLALPVQTAIIDVAVEMIME